EIERRLYYPLDVVTASALSGIEQAILDALGRERGVPVFELLGGARRTSIVAYSNLANGETAANGFVPDAAVGQRQAEGAVRAGFVAVKVKPIAPGFAGDVAAPRDLVRRLRARVGPAIGVALDLHGRCETEAAIALGEALRGEEIAFVEEPCAPGDVA